jgi:peptidoglycan/xylan/chitin deacetylase (PgdA/CDA1 family)
MNWQQLNIMLQSGLCEVGIHTKSHARFTNLSAVKKLQEIVDCKKEIEIRTGAVAHYFAYPYGANIDIGDTTTLNVLMQTVNVKLAFTTIAGELNYNAEAYLLPRIFLNNNCTSYTLRSRLSGAYQRSILKRTRP